MTENGAAPAAGGAGDAGGGTATVAAPTAPAARAPARPQPVHEQVRGEQPQGRGRDGKFAPKADDGPKVMDRSMFKEAATAASRKFMGKSTDDAALDAVKPTGKDQARTDPNKGTQPTGATGTDSKSPSENKPSQPTEHELEKARAALKLMGHDEEDLAAMTPEQTIALGKKATARNAAKSNELREKATAPKPTVETDTDDDAEYERLAKEHFADFDDEDGKFGKSLAGFGRAIAARQSKAMEREIGAIALEAREMLGTIRHDLESALHFELGSRDLKDTFPQSATPEGREAFEAEFKAYRKANPKVDARTALQRAAGTLWGAEIAKANAERKERISTARQGAHSDPTTQSEAPKPSTFHDVARSNVRKHMG